MPVLEFTCDLDAPLEKVWAFYDSIETLFILTPSNTTVRLDGDAVPVRIGVIYKLKMKRWNVIPMPTWYAEIVAYEPPNRFVDRQVTGKGPFKVWQHEHLFAALPGNRTQITDRVTYEPPLGLLGKLADALFIRRDLKAMFRHRHKVTREKLEGGKAPPDAKGERPPSW